MSSCSHTVIRYRSIGTIYNIYNNYRINAVQSHFDMLHFEKHTSIYSFTKFIMIDLENELPAWYHIKVVWDISVDINKINMDY